MTSRRVADTALCFTTPRKLPRASELHGRVVVLDIAFAAEAGGSRHGFEQGTLRFIEALGERLVCWVDHHDSSHHARFASDPRFHLARKAEHGACPEMITPELVAETPRADTLVCHGDFDGLCAAAKWLRGGREPYPGCDDDARAVDTCIGEPSPLGRRLERALRARSRDHGLFAEIVAFLADGARDEAALCRFDAVAAALEPLEREAERLARGYRVLGPDLCLVEVPPGTPSYDKTYLLLLGQRLRLMAAVVDGDTATFAAPFDSGVDFLARFALSGGMPTRVSVRRADLPGALAALGLAGATAPPAGAPAPHDP
ncbi:MAG: hypothetical protein HY908_17995 [Myxococcales bacterium]|nr:hypothetical protein [Myxococcales bacterium]